MGNFCEAFGVTKIEAPSTVRKRLNKKRAQKKGQYQGTKQQFIEIVKIYT